MILPKILLKKLILTQLKIGSLGFGGPLATMALMRDELVDKHKLVTSQRYLEGLAVVKLLPGPVSTLLAVFLGIEIAGFWGGLFSALCFVLPAFLLMLVLSYLSSSLEQLPDIQLYFRSILDVLSFSVLAVIVHTSWKLFYEAWSKSYFGRKQSFWVALFALVALFLAWRDVLEPVILIFSAFMGWVVSRRMAHPKRPTHLSVEPFSIFLLFFTAGLTVFGTGYMILPYLQRELVEVHGWISQKDFLDAVVYGNLTPGPVIIASTYMGFKIASWSGATFATLGIFLGPMILMFILYPLLKKLRGAPWMEGVMLGLLPAVATTILYGVGQIAQKMQFHWLGLVIFLISLLLCFKKISTWKIFLLGMALSIVLVVSGFQV